MEAQLLTACLVGYFCLQAKTSDPTFQAALTAEGAQGLWQLACDPNLNHQSLSSDVLQAMVDVLGKPVVLPELQLAVCCAIWQLAVKARLRQRLVQVSNCANWQTDLHFTAAMPGMPGCMLPGSTYDEQQPAVVVTELYHEKKTIAVCADSLNQAVHKAPLIAWASVGRINDSDIGLQALATFVLFCCLTAQRRRATCGPGSSSVC
jgi:hypothetical protein